MPSTEVQITANFHGTPQEIGTDAVFRFLGPVARQAADQMPPEQFCGMLEGMSVAMLGILLAHLTRGSAVQLLERLVQTARMVPLASETEQRSN